MIEFLGNYLLEIPIHWVEWSSLVCFIGGFVCLLLNLICIKSFKELDKQKTIMSAILFTSGFIVYLLCNVLG